MRHQCPEVLTNLFGAVKQSKSIVSNNIFKREVEDTATVLLEFETGTNAVLTITHSANEPQDTLDIFGTAGTIRVPVLNEGAMILRTGGGGEKREFHSPAENVHLPLIRNFTEAVLNDSEPAITGETGRKIARIIEEIYAE